MNIKEIAIQCGISQNSVFSCSPIEQFAQAVIAEFVKEQKPVAHMYVNGKESCAMLEDDLEGRSIRAHLNESRYKDVVITPLFTLEVK